MMQSNDIRWVQLGDYIELCEERNSDNAFVADDVRGLSTSKQIIDTKANLEGVSLSSYKLLPPRYFAYVADTSRRGDKMSLGYNQTQNTFIVSSISVVFKVVNDELNPDFLYLWFCLPEFDRYARFHSWGSAREAFSYDDMCRVQIPLPSPEKQKELVATWKGLRDMKEQNEAMAAPLMQLCQSRLQELKHTYPLTEIGPYIEQCDERNSDAKYTQDDVRGISTDKKFLPTKANLEGVSLSSYKVVNSYDFAYVADTSRRGDKIALALNTSDESILISSIYTTFNSKDKSQLQPEYLYLMLSRSEFDRYARFHSWGSARETFDWEDMCRVAIPLPPIEEQRTIVNIYKCAAECKRIAEEADRLSREICPALMQKAIRG